MLVFSVTLILDVTTKHLVRYLSLLAISYVVKHINEETHQSFKSYLMSKPVETSTILTYKLLF